MGIMLRGGICLPVTPGIVFTIIHLFCKQTEGFCEKLEKNNLCLALTDLGGVPDPRPPKGPASFVSIHKIFEI